MTKPTDTTFQEMDPDQEMVDPNAVEAEEEYEEEAPAKKKSSTMTNMALGLAVVVVLAGGGLMAKNKFFPSAQPLPNNSEMAMQAPPAAATPPAGLDIASDHPSGAQPVGMTDAANPDALNDVPGQPGATPVPSPVSTTPDQTVQTTIIDPATGLPFGQAPVAGAPLPAAAPAAAPAPVAEVSAAPVAKTGTPSNVDQATLVQAQRVPGLEAQIATLTAANKELQAKLDLLNHPGTSVTEDRPAASSGKSTKTWVAKKSRKSKSSKAKAESDTDNDADEIVVAKAPAKKAPAVDEAQPIESAAPATRSDASLSHVSYTTKAVIAGRAWLSTDKGINETVAVGDILPGAGRVKSINVETGCVGLESGARICN